MRLVPDHVWAIITIWHEAQAEPFAGKVGVAEAIRNRTEAKHMSDGTVAGTCLWPMQFSGWNAHDATPKYRERIEGAKLDTNDPIVQDCIRAWSEAEAGSDTVKGAMYYLNEAVTIKLYGKLPGWVARMDLVAEVEEHKFYKPKG